MKIQWHCTLKNRNELTIPLMMLRLFVTNHIHIQEVRWPKKAMYWLNTQFDRKYSVCSAPSSSLPDCRCSYQLPVPLPFSRRVRHPEGWHSGWLRLWSCASISQATGLISGWLTVSGSGFQSGWKKWILNVRAQFSNTRFSVMKRWWLPFRPRSCEMYIVHSSGPKGS